jgi:lipoprotein NlpD
MKIDFKNIREAKVYITPQFSDSETIRYKIKFHRILLWIFIYTMVTALITIIILGITPLKNLIFHFENAELREQVQKTIELENKIIYLTRELESISSINKKLEYAYILGTSDSIDTTSVEYDSLKYESSENLPYGGNLHFIFEKIWENFLQDKITELVYFIKPSQGLIINDFNPEDGHFGIDFAVHSGSSIFASQGGLVLFSDFTIDDGYKIIIQHKNGFISIYKHCSSLLKSERDVVTQGELIGLSGNSGQNTTGPHLHFEIWKDGKPQNPKEYFIK